MNQRRVVITGLGVITSLGETVEAVWDALCAGKSGIAPATRFDFSQYPVRFGGECTSFDVTRYGIDAREARRLDRFGQFGLAAAVRPSRTPGWISIRKTADRVGVVIGSGIGGIETLEEQNKILVSRGVSRVSPFTVPRLMVNAASGNVSILFGIHGPNTAVATACATGANAIGDAGRLIQCDLADIMIAGGSEAALCELGMGSFCAARALSNAQRRPDPRQPPLGPRPRRLCHGEGAGVVILEELEHARKRGARIYAELVGYGMRPTPITSPPPKKRARVRPRR
jgi:3-oxoacyl-[acyl-carrier-protein] synthase II